MRIAKIFVLLTFVCASQAELDSLLDSANGVIANLLETVFDNANQVTKNLQVASTKSIEELGVLRENLQNAAAKPVKGLDAVLDNIVKTAENQVKNLTDVAEANGADVSECKVLINPLRDAVTNVLKNAQTCGTDTVKEINDFSDNIISLGTTCLNDIQEIKDVILKCTSGWPGIMAIFDSFSCLSSVGMKSGHFLWNKVPSIVRNVLRATHLISDLQSSLIDCVSTNVIEVLNKQRSTVISDVKNCIAKKTDGK